MDEGPRGHRAKAVYRLQRRLGFIDSVMYLELRYGPERKGKTSGRGATRPDAAAALALIQDGIEPELQSMLDPRDEEGFSRSLLPHISRARAMKPGLTRGDVYGALACFILVFVSCLPAAVPFLIFSDPHFALRVSNFLLLGLLFLVGRKWAEYG